jgi:hypothetical protein
MKTGSEGADARYAGAGRLAAWAYAKARNPAFATKAVSTISGGGFRGGGQTYVTRKISAPDVLNEIHEYPAVSTNNASQSSLNIIQVLELCKDRLPSEPPAAGVPEPRQ